MGRNEISKALKEHRTKTGLKADEVGAMIGKSGKTVNAWENNRGQPDADTLIKLAEIYNVSLDELLVNKNKLKLNEHPLLKKYNKLNKEGKNKVDDYIDDLLDSGKYKEEYAGEIGVHNLTQGA